MEGRVAVIGFGRMGSAMAWRSLARGERWALVTKDVRPQVWVRLGCQRRTLSCCPTCTTWRIPRVTTPVSRAPSAPTGLHDLAVEKITGSLEDAGVVDEKPGVDLAQRGLPGHPGGQLNSLETPVEIEEGMLFALATLRPPMAVQQRVSRRRRRSSSPPMGARSSPRSPARS